MSLCSSFPKAIYFHQPYTRDGNLAGWICARGGSLFATMYKGLLFESDISFEEMTRSGSLCNTVKMSIQRRQLPLENKKEYIYKRIFATTELPA